LRPETIREDCPLALAVTIERALALSPDDRYPSAAALAEAIQAVFPLASRTTAQLGELVRGRVLRSTVPWNACVADCAWVVLTMPAMAIEGTDVRAVRAQLKELSGKVTELRRLL